MTIPFGTLRRLPAITALAALAALASTAPATAETIRIAIAGPMTGPLSQYGDMVKAGALTAIERINASGSLGAHKFEAVLMDDACEPKQAVAVANKIAGERIRYVIGHVCSGSTIPAADVYENEGILMITPSSTAPQLTEGKKKQMIFRTIGRDDQQGPVAAAYIIAKVKPKKVAVLHDKQSYGQGIASAVRQQLEAARVPVALFEGVNKGDSDYSAVVTKLKAQGVDFIYFGGYHPELGLIMRQSAEQGIKARFMGPEGVANKDLSAIAGAATEGMLVTLPADFLADPANAEVAQAFKKSGRDADGPFQMPAYSAVQVIADSITAGGSTDPAKVAAHLRKNAFQTPIGKVEYDDRGDLRSFKFVVYEWHQDATKTVAPE